MLGDINIVEIAIQDDSMILFLSLSLKLQTNKN